MENKVDYQIIYNFIVCYYVFENIEQMKNCFIKMLFVKYYDFDFDDENDDENFVLWVYFFFVLVILLLVEYIDIYLF